MNHLHAILLLLLSCPYTLLPISATTPGNDNDRLALLAFKSQITFDPTGLLTSWNTSTPLCLWQGIICNNQSQRVTNLTIESYGLVGSLSPSLSNLTYLEELDVGDNSLHGDIPSELGNLLNLRSLNLSSNSFSGTIPSNLSHCKQLRYLMLKFNQLVGEIPREITSMQKLTVLFLQANNLTGSIPVSIGNLSSLNMLALGRNSLSGSIPDSIGLLRRLNFLQIAENQLSGAIPRSLYNLSSLSFVTIAGNQLHGSLPSELGFNLPNLETLYMGGNLLTGSIPHSIVNASGLINLDLADNNFTGSVPVDIGKLSGLEWLNFEENELGIGDVNGLEFIDSLINCTNLGALAIDNNGFEGLLPNSIGNLSAQLSLLLISQNKISGSIPKSIGGLTSLTMLRMEKNLLSGSIPDSIGNLQNLQILSLFRNKLSGEIPSSLGNLSQLNDLRLGENSIQGRIPSSLANCGSLQQLDLSWNKIDGEIPAGVIGLSSLSILLSLAHNSLVGSLPTEVGNLKNLNRLDISDNRLSGGVPQSLGNCESLEYLHMEGNMFQGVIPSSLNKLKAIQYIDLSTNNLSGQIPSYLGKFQSLWYLNLSYNDFEGVVPEEGVLKNASALSIIGNGKLCGGLPMLQLPSCTVASSKKKASRWVIQVIIPIVCVVLGLALLSCFLVYLYFKRSARKPTTAMASSVEEAYMKVSYRELLKATDGFSSTNLIGRGGYGTVYRGYLNGNRTVVAIKVLNLENHGASKSFLRECEVLRHIRHRNLIKILTVCSSENSKGNEFKALVYEFMPNGSLEEWLHQDIEKQQYGALSLAQRLNIAIDVASALDYLHHQNEVPIVHCDLKPSNVLLDDDLIAHVSDFGLAKILLEDKESQFQTGSIAIKGSIGYVPPEYGMGSEVSTMGDVYSYGVLLLEMFTGKRPTDATLNEGSCLHDLVKASCPERVMQIIDPFVLEDKEREDYSKIEECMVSVIGIGLSCSAASPRERMDISNVIVEMIHIRARFIGVHES